MSSRQSAILDFFRILKRWASSLVIRLIVCQISNLSDEWLLSYGVIHKLGMLKYAEVSISSSCQSAILEFFGIPKRRASSLVTRLTVSLKSRWSYKQLLSYGVIHKLGMLKTCTSPTFRRLASRPSWNFSEFWKDVHRHWLLG